MIPVETLRALPCFAGVGIESLKAVAAITHERDYKPGEPLVREGDPAQCLFIVRHGEVDILYALQGGETRVVDTVVAGDLLGWSAVMEPYQITATCVARDEVHVLCVDAAGIRKLCEEDHSLGFRLMTKVALEIKSRLQGASIQLAAGG